MALFKMFLYVLNRALSTSYNSLSHRNYTSFLYILSFVLIDLIISFVTHFCTRETRRCENMHIYIYMHHCYYFYWVTILVIGDCILTKIITTKYTGGRLVVIRIRIVLITIIKTVLRTVTLVPSIVVGKIGSWNTTKIKQINNMTRLAFLLQKLQYFKSVFSL